MPSVATSIRKTRKRRKESPQEFFKRNQIKEYLVSEWKIEQKIANTFARKHLTIPFEDVIKTVETLVNFFEKAHFCHYGYKMDPKVLSGALTHSLRRISRNQNPLSEKQLNYFIQLARDEVASKMTTCYDPGSQTEREKVMTPLKQVLHYEEDEAMRNRLLFIYYLFVQRGMRLTKNKVIQACASDSDLFPHRRVVEDAIETLRGAYEAVGFLKGELFITPEYLSFN